MKKFVTVLTAVSAMFVLSACAGLQTAWEDFLQYADYQYINGTAGGNVALTVHFDFDSDALSSDAAADIADLADSIASSGSIGVVVVGHTDTSGDAAYNDDLSQRRANRVRNALVAGGVNPNNTRVDTFAEGEMSPAVKTGDGVPERANRRVTVQTAIIGSQSW
jgi:outer membrane protein OmpA-like peptidoglycan-associated protein